MFEAPGIPRPHYRALFQTLLDLPPEELRKSQQAADLSFLHQGITFTVYGNSEGTERVFPNDLLPRIIPHAEWGKIERGLAQRIAALNLFLEDIYHSGKILADGVVPRNSSIVAATSAARYAVSTSLGEFTSAFAAPTWCASPTAASPYSKTISVCPAASPTCWPTGKS